MHAKPPAQRPAPLFILLLYGMHCCVLSSPDYVKSILHIGLRIPSNCIMWSQKYSSNWDILAIRYTYWINPLSTPYIPEIVTFSYHFLHSMGWICPFASSFLINMLHIYLNVIFRLGLKLSVPMAMLDVFNWFRTIEEARNFLNGVAPVMNKVLLLAMLPTMKMSCGFSYFVSTKKK